MRFRLVDRIDAVNDDGIAGRKLIAQSEDILDWHFPEKAVFPGTMILESCVQLAGWWHASRKSFSEWLLLRCVESARYVEMCLPGDVLDIRLEANPQSGDAKLVSFVARVTSSGRPRAEIRFETCAVPLDSLTDPQDCRREFEELQGTSPS